MKAGRAWLAANWSAKRATICRALKIDPAEPGASYATGPFAIMQEDGASWIAGAVGIWRAFDPTNWSVDDISDVILWNPRTGEIRILGDTSPTLITPDRPEPRLTVYGQGFAFFRAWADRRAEILARIRIAHESHRVTGSEPTDSGIPGALVIGDLAKIEWRNLGAAVLVAGPGTDARKLNRAVIRSARLPRIESLAA